MSIAYNGMPIGVTASSKIILLTNIIFEHNTTKSMERYTYQSLLEADFLFSVLSIVYLYFIYLLVVIMILYCCESGEK